jgi:hypothetical protein
MGFTYTVVVDDNGQECSCTGGDDDWFWSPLWCLIIY